MGFWNYVRKSGITTHEIIRIWSSARLEYPRRGPALAPRSEREVHVARSLGSSGGVPVGSMGVPEAVRVSRGA